MSSEGIPASLRLPDMPPTQSMSAPLSMVTSETRLQSVPSFMSIIADSPATLGGIAGKSKYLTFQQRK